MSILRSLQREVEGGVRLMLGSLVEILKGRSKLPVLYKAIVFLRQLGGWDEEELSVLFLCCRGAFIENLHSANETAQIGSAGTSESQRDMARYLRGYIDIFREGVYDLVSAYTTIFLDHAQNTEGASRGTQDELIFLLSVFTSNQISSLMRTLSLHLSSVHDFTSLSSLLTQLNYCGSSFARIGLEFRPLLTKHFEQAVLMNIKQSMEHAATESTSGPGSPTFRLDKPRSSLSMERRNSEIITPQRRSFAPGADVTGRPRSPVLQRTGTPTSARAFSPTPTSARPFSPTPRQALTTEEVKAKQELERSIVLEVGKAHARILAPFLLKALVVGVYGKPEEMDPEDVFKGAILEWEKWYGECLPKPVNGEHYDAE
ncbi:hypothetical protein FRC14_001235 [Serendipita sp. 396]|nr:hypothetical protein FRC14_001235 [Serendipita sp. 396]